MGDITKEIGAKIRLAQFSGEFCYHETMMNRARAEFKKTAEKWCPHLMESDMGGTYCAFNDGIRRVCSAKYCSMLKGWGA